MQRIFSLQCDPRADAGTVGLTDSLLAAARDRFAIALDGDAAPGLLAASTKMASELPSVLSVQADSLTGFSRMPRISLSWEALRRPPLLRGPADGLLPG